MQLTALVWTGVCLVSISALPAGVSGRVRLLILIGEDDLTEQGWMRAAVHGGGFDFLSPPDEDIYTLEDGKPFDDAR